MSNAKKRSSGKFSLAAYEAKVAKKDTEPFVLEISETETITIPRPTGGDNLKIEAALRNGDSRQLIYALAEDDDQAEQILELFENLDGRVMVEFGKDVAKFFNIGGAES